MLVWFTYSAFKFTIPCGRTLFFGCERFCLLQDICWVLLVKLLWHHPMFLSYDPRCSHFFSQKVLHIPLHFQVISRCFFSLSVALVPSQHPIHWRGNSEAFDGGAAACSCAGLRQRQGAAKYGDFDIVEACRSNMGRYQQNMEIS